MSEPGRHAGSDECDAARDGKLKPLVFTRPPVPSLDPRVAQSVRRTAELFGVGELYAAYITVQMLHEVLERAGLAGPLPPVED